MGIKEPYWSPDRLILFAILLWLFNGKAPGKLFIVLTKTRKLEENTDTTKRKVILATFLQE